MATKNRIVLDNAVERLNSLIEKTGKKIVVQGRNNYICLDYEGGGNMIDSFKTTKLALKGVYNMIEMAKLFN